MKPREYLPWPEQRSKWLSLAAFRLALPPGETSERVAAKGECVARFVLPLELCKPQNRKRAPTKGSQFAELKTRRNVYAQMRAQCTPPVSPLTGRPQVLCVRFSSSEPDKYSDWAKVPVDCLCEKTERAKERLGIIADEGSDPIVSDVLGFKKAQADGVMGERDDVLDSSGANIKALAQMYLARNAAA